MFGIKTYYPTLTEVKAGQTGKGLLIEHDGHIMGDSDMISQIKEDIAHHNEYIIPDHFMVSAIFQKYGVKNANGRVYPEGILKREVEKYINERVANRSSIGALDHPQCQLAGTRILTENGWKNIEDASVSEKILTLTKEKHIEIHPIQNKIEQMYNGEIIRLHNRSIDLKVTPNHKFPVFDRNKNFKGYFTAQQMFDNEIPDQSHSYLIKTGIWNGREDKTFVIPGLEKAKNNTMYHKRFNKKYSEDLSIPMETWAKFLGIYLSEGCTTGCDKVSIYQLKEDVCNDIREMLNDFPLEYHEYKKGKIKCFTIYDMRLAAYLSQFGTCYDKYIPLDFKQQSRDTLKIFYDWFVMGDGRGRGRNSKNYYTDDVFSTSEKLAMDLNEIQLKIGYCGSFHKENRKHDRCIEGRLISGEKCSDMYFTYRSLTEHICIGKLSFEKEDYNGMVYCVEVENHNFYTMDWYGHCVWSGNSSTISGHDVSHVITNLEWMGKTLIGEMEIHTTPGFKKYGVASTSGDLVANMLINNIQIGVSSRAVGSVEQKLGVLVVGDDLELLAWDVVAEPSTPGAFIAKSREELQQYAEADETKQGKPLVNEKINKIKEILL